MATGSGISGHSSDCPLIVGSNSGLRNWGLFSAFAGGVDQKKQVQRPVKQIMSQKRIWALRDLKPVKWGSRLNGVQGLKGQGSRGRNLVGSEGYQPIPCPSEWGFCRPYQPTGVSVCSPAFSGAMWLRRWGGMALRLRSVQAPFVRYWERQQRRGLHSISFNGAWVQIPVAVAQPPCNLNLNYSMLLWQFDSCLCFWQRETTLD